VLCALSQEEQHQFIQKFIDQVFQQAKGTPDQQHLSVVQKLDSYKDEINTHRKLLMQYKQQNDRYKGTLFLQSTETKKMQVAEDGIYMAASLQ
jgi:hypothetical protein